jgi:hypothetical protein
MVDKKITTKIEIEAIIAKAQSDLESFSESMKEMW